ncbi:MAG TPA: hypothetical protein VLG28_00435 [Acidimicrobiia bacterium]|nr:hypothetical protein [Acidimicrobiia bacterium]
MLRTIRHTTTARGHLMVPLFAQAVEDTFPDEAGGRVIFVIVGVAIVALYLVLRRTRRRTEEAYWERRRREKARRDNDPDMRRDDT